MQLISLPLRPAANNPVRQISTRGGMSSRELGQC